MTVLLQVYSVFSPYRIADYLQKFLPGHLTYFELGVLLVLAIALLVGRRTTMTLLLLAFGAFEGYIASNAVMAHIALTQQESLLLVLFLSAAGAFVVYEISKIALAAFIGLTLGAAFIDGGASITAAAFATVASFGIILLFYKHVASFLAGVIGSVLLLLFLIQLNIPGATPYVVSAAAFILSIAIRYLFSKAGRQRMHAIRKPSPARAHI